MAIRTIFSMAEDCAAGRRTGWEEFARDYSGIARRLLEQYFSALLPEMDAHAAAVFARARADGSAWFRGLRFSNEREFLMAFRDLVFAYGRQEARLPVPQLSLEQVRAIMQDQPLVEREILWFFIKGYGAARIAPIMMHAAATVEEVKKLADERLARAIPGSSPDAFTISCRALMEQAELARGEQCASLKMFNDLVNGQISWRDRELLEQHMLQCFHCLDRFTTFLELIRLRKDVPAALPVEIERIVGPLSLPAAEPSGLMGRLFSRR